MTAAQYLYDPTVTPEQDRDLRELFSLCFPDRHFHLQRFKYELPSHRWIMRSPEKRPVAHVGLHDKRMESPDGEFRVGGVAEVCVHPDFRGRGFMRTLMEEMHAWCRSENLHFAALFGQKVLYTRYGYRPPGNPLKRFDVDLNQWVIRPEPAFHVLEFTECRWPEGPIHLRGPKF